MSYTSSTRPSRPFLVALASAACGALLLTGCTSTGAYRAKVTPQRPTVSNTTQTAAFGTLEVEAGAQLDPSDRTQLDATARVGLSETSELFVSHAPYVNIDRAGSDVDGGGDLIIGYRQRLLDESRDFPAFAIEFATSLPVGEEDPLISEGGGYTSFFGGLTVDRTFGDLLTSFYYRLGALGTPQAGDLNAQHTFALAGYLPLYDKFSGVAELAAVSETETDLDPLSLNAAVFYEVSENLLFDIGFQLGLNNDADDFVIVGGVTTNLGRIF